MGKTEALRTNLYDKVYAEFQTFIAEIKKLPPGEIINKSYEVVSKEDIVMSFDSQGFLSDRQMEALLKANNTLNACYEAWMDTDCTYMDMIQDSIENCANDRSKELAAEKASKKKADKEPER